MNDIYKGLNIKLDGRIVSLKDELDKIDRKECECGRPARPMRRVRRGHGDGSLKEIYKCEKLSAKRDGLRLRRIEILFEADKQLSGKISKKQEKQLQRDLFDATGPREQYALGLKYEWERKVYRVKEGEKILVDD